MLQSASPKEAPMPSSIENLEPYSLFCRHFVKKKELGRGSDGIVTSYSDYLGFEVAVKTPRKKILYDIAESVREEVRNLKAIGKHDNIVGMIAFCEDFRPIGPGIIFEVCDLGDLATYWVKWCEKQFVTKLLSPRIPEITILKLMRDVSLGLDFLHNGNALGYVHGDLKPGNILVCTPPGYTAGDVPAEPIFKITDFGRMSTYPRPEGYKQRRTGFGGTFEYAPPEAEQTDPVKPAIDIWALGATIQFLALGMDPIQSRAAVIKERGHDYECCPQIGDDETWGSEYWRRRRAVVYRPLNVTKEELFKDWDINENDCNHDYLQFHTPYSGFLDRWYNMLFDTDPEARVTSAHLKKYVVPLIEQRILVERKLALAIESFDKVIALRDSADGLKIEGNFCLPKGEGMVQFPSYEGNGY